MTRAATRFLGEATTAPTLICKAVTLPGTAVAVGLTTLPARRPAA